MSTIANTLFFGRQVAQAVIMVSSVVIVALFGIFEVGGLHEVWNRAVNGGRIHPPEYETQSLSSMLNF